MVCKLPNRPSATIIISTCCVGVGGSKTIRANNIRSLGTLGLSICPNCEKRSSNQFVQRERCFGLGTGVCLLNACSTVDTHSRTFLGTCRGDSTAGRNDNWWLAQSKWNQGNWKLIPGMKCHHPVTVTCSSAWWSWNTIHGWAREETGNASGRRANQWELRPVRFATVGVVLGCCWLCPAALKVLMI